MSHFENIIPDSHHRHHNHQENTNFYNLQSSSDKPPLSLCEFTSNGQSSSGPSSTSSTTSLTPPFCTSSLQQLSNYFSSSNEINSMNQKDDQNPIDRLYSMQNSYFCSKC